MSTFEPGTEVAMIFKAAPMSMNPRSGEVAWNVMKGTFIGDVFSGPPEDAMLVGYRVRLESFTPAIANAVIRDDELLVIGEISQVSTVGGSVVLKPV